MSNFQDRIERVCRDIPGKVFKVIYLIDKGGHNVALVINKVLWYAIRVIYQIHEGGGENDIIMEKKSEHLTLQGALDKVDDYRRELSG